ncbi:MAG: hypothetical protein AAF196_07560 [Planctomycetota bacterium]
MVWTFWLAFVLTVLLLGVAAWAGKTGRRRLHFIFAPLGVAALTTAIILTERLSRAYDFPPEEMKIHLALAKSAAGLVLLAVISGLAAVKNRGALKVHKVCVLLAVVLILVATSTGIWVFSLATPR